MFIRTLFSILIYQNLTAQIPADFVEVKKEIPTIVLDLRYFGDHNFIGKPIRGYKAPKCYLTREAANSLQKVQEELLPFGLSLKIYDSYRPQRAVDHFVEWARNLADTTMKREFYPDVPKEILFDEGYIAGKSSHTRGSTVDITIVPLNSQPAAYAAGQELCDCRKPASERFKDNSLDMGTGYDCFDPLSWTIRQDVIPEQRANRLLLKSLLEKHGFKNYEKEWWHFTLRNEPFPNTYFDFEIK